MPVGGIQHRARVEDDFSGPAESRNREHVAVVQTSPVIAVAVARDPNPVPAPHFDLPFLINLESSRVLERQGKLLMPVLNPHVAVVVPTSHPEHFTTANPVKILVELHHQPLAVVLGAAAIRLLPAKILITDERFFRSEQSGFPLRLANRFRHFRSLRVRRRHHQWHMPLAAQIQKIMRQHPVAFAVVGDLNDRVQSIKMPERRSQITLAQSGDRVAVVFA